MAQRRLSWVAALSGRRKSLIDDEETQFALAIEATKLSSRHSSFSSPHTSPTQIDRPISPSAPPSSPLEASSLTWRHKMFAGTDGDIAAQHLGPISPLYLRGGGDDNDVHDDKQSQGNGSPAKEDPHPPVAGNHQRPQLFYPMRSVVEQALKNHEDLVYTPGKPIDPRASSLPRPSGIKLSKDPLQGKFDYSRLTGVSFNLALVFLLLSFDILTLAIAKAKH
jgi:hypothetical protein